VEAEFVPEKPLNLFLPGKTPGNFFPNPEKPLGSPPRGGTPGQL